ncbi:hypothetical protein FRC08_010446 [Ceratobasidium sp. 394]|nr:hypothetical protein FRC08_010446 [Ceratobasidium sp. 394]
MVFTSILVHGITVPAMKVVVHGVTLTRTSTQMSNIGKPRPAGPVSLDNIHRIGIAVPVPTFHSTTGERIAPSFDPDPHRVGSEMRVHVGAGSPRLGVVHAGEEQSVSPLPDAEGRTVTFSGP